MAKTVTFYHGTSAGNARSIRKNGLKPSAGVTSSLDYARPPKRVYLSTSKTNAKFYASGKRTTVLKVNVPASVARTFKRDRIGLPADVHTSKAIPAKYIQSGGRKTRPTARGKAAPSAGG